MNKKIIIAVILILIILLVTVLLVYFIYNFYVLKNNTSKSPEVVKKNITEIKIQQQQKIEADYNAKFPDVITGVISIISDQKTTIKTEKGVEYLISPARPKSFFSDSKIVNGSAVEVRGKISGTNKINLGSIVTVKK